MNEPNNTIRPLDNAPDKPSGIPLLLGIALTCLALWLVFDSVRVTSGCGWLTGMMGGYGGNMNGSGWMGLGASTGIVFVPFIAGIIAIFYNFKAKWAYWLSGIGIAVILVEMLSRIRFVFNMKSSHLLLMLGMLAAGLGLCLHGYFRHTHSKPDVAK